MKKWFDLAVRIFLGGVFVYASWDKILHPAAFAETIYNYQILPGFLINTSAVILPWLELLLGICLIAGFWVPGALLSVNVLMIIFIGAFLFNVQRGLNIHCGCFETTPSSAGEISNGLLILRDSIFLSSGTYLLFSVFLDKRKQPAAGA